MGNYILEEAVEDCKGAVAAAMAPSEDPRDQTAGLNIMGLDADREISSGKRWQKVPPSWRKTGREGAGGAGGAGAARGTGQLSSVGLPGFSGRAFTFISCVNQPNKT